MNKFLIATSALFLATQPLKAGWLSSYDYDQSNDWLNEPEDPTSFPVRQITYNFGKEKPESNSEKYTSVALKNAKSQIENLYVRDRIALSFDNVNSTRHVQTIEYIIENLDLDNVSVDVSFKKGALNKVNKLWNEVWSAKIRSHQAFLEERNQRRLDRQQQYNDFTESHSGWEADLMDQEGYFGAGSSDDASESEGSDSDFN